MINLKTDNNMPILLTDFTVEQINELLTIVEEKQSDLNYKINKINDFLRNDSSIRLELVTQYGVVYDIMILWETQLRNALSEIAAREQIKSN